jgi:acetoin:2,6-dichlorophenolindophenol oxidoreductase subunit alpha
MDVFAVESVAAEAIARARRGGGPTLIEAMTYRYYGQYEGDKQTYKPPDEVERYRAADPLLRFRASMADRIDPGQLDSIDRAVADEVTQAFLAAEAAPWPDPRMLAADVYAEWPT